MRAWKCGASGVFCLLVFTLTVVPGAAQTAAAAAAASATDFAAALPKTGSTGSTDSTDSVETESPPESFVTPAPLIPAPTMPAPAGPEVDEQALLKVPQDLTFFAAKLDPSAPLISPDVQAARDARSTALFFGPWNLRKPGVSAAQFRQNLSQKPRGFADERPWNAETWGKLVRNADAAHYPSPLGEAVVITHADVRSLPTAEPLFMEPTAERTLDYFDFFQLTALPTGTPVYISHVSADKQWFYVENPLVPGWVHASAVALVSRDFIRQYRRKPLAVATRDELPLLTAEGRQLGLAWVGTAFPLAEEGASKKILVPWRGEDGMARLAEVTPPEGSFLPKPLPLTPENMARLGNEMLGRPYMWGGIGQGRDCSLATRDLFFSFGIWLPRNSRSQMGSDAMDLSKLSPEKRKEVILKKGEPFMTLLGFPGHIGLYVGEQDGEPIMFHTILGLRTNHPDGWLRHIIGKGILSTLEPGADIPELYVRETLLERLTSMRVIR